MTSRKQSPIANTAFSRPNSPTPGSRNGSPSRAPRAARPPRLELGRDEHRLAQPDLGCVCDHRRAGYRPACPPGPARITAVCRSRRSGSHPTMRSTSSLPTLHAHCALLAALFALCALGCTIAPARAGAAVATPAASTDSASGVSYSTATLKRTVNAKGEPTNYFFEIGTTRKYGTLTPLAPAGSRTVAVKVSQALSGLRAVTTYHYRIVAVGPGGSNVGADRTFTTRKDPPVARDRRRAQPSSLRKARSPSRARSRGPMDPTTSSSCRRTSSPTSADFRTSATRS